MAMPIENDDPRKLRDLLTKAANLASDHELSSVLVGLSGFEGDRLFPEIVDFVESALRVEDAVFRMTRERAVFCIADSDESRAQVIMERVLGDFRAQFATAAEPLVAIAYYEVKPGAGDVSVKSVLPSLFTSPPSGH